MFKNPLKGELTVVISDYNYKNENLDFDNVKIKAKK